jgi:murein DD-endopeptidase MepM/ murein hydrolase activator NlpD
VKPVTVAAMAMLCASVLGAAPHIAVESECVPGGVLTIRATSISQSGALAAQLLDESRDVVSENVFFSLSVGGIDRYYALLGVPDTLEHGSYLVAIITGDGGLVEYREVTIHSVEFRTETINLDRSLSELHRTDEQRRLDEAKLLWEITMRSDRNSVYNVGAFDVPVQNSTTTSFFGDRRLYVYADAQTQRSVHTGVDLAAPRGTEVTASGDGKVVLAVERLLTGNTVVIEHLPGVYSLYYHLERIDTKPGETVTRQSVIGTLGSSGLATGPHLHWEFRIGGVSVDPSVMTTFSF